MIPNPEPYRIGETPPVYPYEVSTIYDPQFVWRIATWDVPVKKYGLPIPMNPNITYKYTFTEQYSHTY